MNYEKMCIRDSIRTYPITMPGIPHIDSRESIDVRTYKRNPIEFLERVDETLTRNTLEKVDGRSSRECWMNTSKTSTTTGGRQPGTKYKDTQSSRRPSKQNIGPSQHVITILPVH